MKSSVYSAAALLVAAGSAMAAKDDFGASLLSAGPGASGGVAGGERTGEVITFTVSELPSNDGQSDPDNVVHFLNIGAGNSVNGLGWDVTLSAFAPSWRSEIAVLISDSSGGGGVVVRPGVADASPGGPTGYSSEGILKLANYQLPDIATLADGLIRLEFFETYDDVDGQTDGLWDSGLLFLQVVPTPATAGLLGLAGVGLLGRKRR